MDTDLNFENVKKIINSDTVPGNDKGGLTFYIDETYVNVVKPYINEDGDESGNYVYIESENETGLFIKLNEYLTTLYNTKEKPDFTPLDSKSPQQVIAFLHKIWKEIMIGMKKREDAWNGVGNKLTYENFKKIFGKHKLPDDLKILFDFEAKNGAETFSECFYLTAGDKTGIATWSDDEAFINAFIEFAGANGSGSSYAIWLYEKNIDECPIVVFGDEGGVHVVANSIKELIHILTYDVEISVSHEEAYFYKDEEYYEESENRNEFVNWVKENFGLDPIDSDEYIEQIIESAQKKYQNKLNTFLKKFDIEI